MHIAKPAKRQVITINAVEYNSADIAKAVLGAIPIKPEEGTIVDSDDAVELLNFEKTAVFKTEGKLKVIAKGTDAKGFVHKGYVLVNKHSLKKTHAEYETARPPQQYGDSRERGHFENRPYVRRERSY